MEWIVIVTLLALIEYVVFTGFVGSRRVKYDIAAPKVAGNEQYERAYRVQANTVEQLIVFLPALWICGYLGSTTIATVAGLTFVVGRAIYAVTYMQNPEKRTIGFILGFLSNFVLIVTSAVRAIQGL